MKIEIITIGDEIMQGIIADTNKVWISKKCAGLGHEIIGHVSVCDDFEDISNALKAASKKADCVIVTGGLGPTSDDITIEAAARCFGLGLVLDLDVLEKIRARLVSTGRMMSPGNEKQAMIPEGTRVLSNQVGTAPGVLMTVGKSDFYFLPGVPKELHRMFEDFVMPRLAAKVAGFFCEKTLRCFGIPEADIGDRLKDVELCGARLSYRIKFPEVLLKLTLRGEDRKKVAESAVIAAKNIRERIGNFIYGEGDAGLPAVVGGQLASHGFSIAIAESCTGGLVSSMMTDVAGSSEYFERGVISYSNKSKIELLGISEEILKAHGAVSAPTAISMAREIKRISGTDLGLSVTGIAGPGGGTPEKPVGLVFVGLASPDGIWAFKYNYNCDRLWFKSLAAATALDLVRRYFLECLPNDRQVC